MRGLLPRDSGCTCDKISYFNRKCSVEYLTGIVPACGTLPTELAPVIPNPENAKVAYATSMKTFTCICCKLTFTSNEEQKAHFKSSEHAALVCKNMPRPVSNGWLYETWSDTDSDSSFESSTSSESEDEEEQDKNLCELKSPEIMKKDVVGSLAMFRNRRQEIIGIHRCLIRSQEAPVRYFDDVLKRIELLRTSQFWAFLLYSGGKFAGAIFDEDRVVVHKTFHRYTVRAKQGGSQAARDGALGGMSGHKSAGSALRRHGEMAIRSDIANLLHVKWRSYMQACQLILTMTARRNRSIFTTPPSSCCTLSEPSNVNTNEDNSSENDVGDKEPILASGPDPQAVEAVSAKMGLVAGDPRLRRLSGGARSISYAHIKELQAEFSKFRVYEPSVDLGLISLSDRRQMEEGVPMIFESKSGRLFYGTLPELLRNTSSSVPQKTSEEPSDSSNPPQTPTVEQPVAPSVSKNQRKRRHRKIRHKKREKDTNQLSSTPDSSSDSDDSNDASTRRADEWMNTTSSSRPNQSSPDKPSLNSTYDKYMRQILMATANRNEEDLQQLLTVPNPTVAAARGIEIPPDKETLHSLLNSVHLWFGKGLLHTAVELGDDPDILDILLNAGCKLEVKDANGMTAYQFAEKIGKRKLTAHLKNLRKEYPDRYDYVKAGLPPLHTPSNPGGSMKKKNQPTTQTTEEITRKMDRLSMREKCAAAAEKRASQNQLKGKPTLTCSKCSADMTGIEPFSYFNFVFCSSECMRKHRQQQNKS